ncbi:MAG: MTH1187 family thiamine-binding protein [Desulfobacterales bacterium]|jgi:uncharacterized protein (TIGR00106 family)|nr:MTH1187 family thiamine-binding protein [Desulfobacterales bacterium]
MSVLVHFSIFPMDKGDHLSGYVARALRIIQKSGLPYRLEAMGTTIEGEWEEIINVVTRCYEDLNADCGRILINLKMDCKRGQGGRMTEKVRTVEAKL